MGCFVAFERLKASQGEHDFLRSLVNRSLFQRPVVLMLVNGLQDSRGAISQRLRDVLSRHLNKCTSTTVIEDCFNSMKFDKVYIRRRKKSHAERAMSVVVSNELLGRRHDYNELNRNLPVLARGVKVPEQVFKVDYKGQSLPFKEVVSTRAAPTWFSPNAERAQSPITDLELYLYSAQHGFGRLSTCWLGALARAEHKFMMRKVSGDGGSWQFVLGPVGDSAVLVWPAVTRTITPPGGAGEGVTFFEPVVPLTSVSLEVVCVASEWQAMPFEWRSPAWSASQHPALAIPTRLLAVQNGESDSLLRVSARQALWGLDLPFLQALAGHIGCQRGRDATCLFEVAAAGPTTTCFRR